METFLIFFFFVAPLAVLLPILMRRRRRRRKYYSKKKPNGQYHAKKARLFRPAHHPLPVVHKKSTGYDLAGYYDNEIFYEKISCRDYLTYKLLSLQTEISQAISEFEEEQNWIKEQQLDTEKSQSESTENKKFPSSYSLSSPREFVINVKLHLLDSRGVKRESKEERFNAEAIRRIQEELNNKDGERYRNPEIWEALCRVERGKITNKIRFAIYERDGHRCRKCHAESYDLEIDHIVPIAKGGKSTIDNLQTLCHRCNVEKGVRTERWI